MLDVVILDTAEISGEGTAGLEPILVTVMAGDTEPTIMEVVVAAAVPSV